MLYKFCVGFVFYIFLPVSQANQETTRMENIKKLQLLSLEELMEIPVVSVATGMQQNASDAPAVTTVITSKDIQAMGATNLSDILATVPGFHVSRNGVGYFPIYTVRGIYTGQYNPEVAFLVNNIPISTGYTGGHPIFMGEFPLQNIEKIEIIRGPGSAVYGADAFSAVVNLITKTAKDIDGIQIGARIGSFNTKETWLQQGEKIGDYNVALSVELKESNGDKSIIEEDLATQMDRLFRQTKHSNAPSGVSRGEQNLDTRLDVSNENWQWKSGAQLRRKLGTGVGLRNSLDPNGAMEGKVLSSDLTYHNKNIAKEWEFTAQASVYHYDIESEDFLMFVPKGFFSHESDPVMVKLGVAETQGRLSTDAFYKGFKNHLLRIGTGVHYTDLYRVKNIGNYDQDHYYLPYFIDKSGTPADFMNTAIRKNAHFFIQDVYSLEKNWELTSGLRYDYYGDFGSAINPRLALVWKTLPNLTTKLLYGRAFRAPSFFELYGRSNAVSLGNPTLKPETIQTYEFVMNYQPITHWRLGLNLFAFDLKQGIGYLPAGGDFNENALMAQNAGEQKGKGFEIESRYQLDKHLVLSGHYAFTNTTENNPQATLGNTPHPKQSAYVRADWQFQQDWRLNLQMIYTGKRTRAYIDPRPSMPAYTVFDLNLNYQPKQNLSISTGIKNLLNKSISDPSSPPNSLGLIGIPYDLPLPRRNYFVEMRYQF